jgi:thiamine-phosphate diphosphorylase
METGAMATREPLGEPIICLVTDGSIPAHAGGARIDAWITWMASAAGAGVTLLHVREPQLPDRLLFLLVQELIGAAAASPARIVVSERMDVALAAGAHGVHLKSSSADVGDVRHLAPPGFLVGRSVHGLEEACAAQESGADYLMFGTVFSSRSKPRGSPVAGLKALRAVVRATRVPVVAIGGMTVARAGRVATTGAAGVAAIGMFLGSRAPADRTSEEIGGIVRAIKAAFDRGRVR